MKNRAFTLTEIVVVCVIIGIFATLGLPFFQNVIEASKQKVCDTNLLTAKKAVELYTMEHDTVPGALSQINDKYIEKAYASVMASNGDWKTKLAYLLVEGPQWGLAYAGTYAMPKLKCPCNTNTAAGAVSYGINSQVAGISSFAYKALPDITVIVADAAREVYSYGSSSGSNYDKDFSPASLSEREHRDSHKKYIFLKVEYYLRGVTKNDSKGTYQSSGMFYPD